MNDQVCFKPRPFEAAFLQSGTGYGAFTTEHFIWGNDMIKKSREDLIGSALLSFKRVQKGLPVYWKPLSVLSRIRDNSDRGGEFKHPEALECGIDNVLRTSIYYCDPMASWQKPHCEKNHEYIRKICPQTTTTFDRLTQKDVNLMMSHINSANRESLGGLTPFTLAKLMLPKKLMKHFGLKEIPSDEIILTPALLKGKIEI